MQNLSPKDIAGSDIMTPKVSSGNPFKVNYTLPYESYLSNQPIYNCSFEKYCSTETDYIHNAYWIFHHCPVHDWV